MPIAKGNRHGPPQSIRHRRRLKWRNEFWEHGYEGASRPYLLIGMHLTLGSLYKSFNDKKSLFLTVLNRYEDSAFKARYRFCHTIASLMAGTVG
jgi:hypothetical protein